MIGISTLNRSDLKFSEISTNHPPEKKREKKNESFHSVNASLQVQNFV